MHDPVRCGVTDGADRAKEREASADRLVEVAEFKIIESSGVCEVSLSLRSRSDGAHEAFVFPLLDSGKKWWQAAEKVAKRGECTLSLEGQACGFRAPGRKRPSPSAPEAPPMTVAECNHLIGNRMQLSLQ